MSATRHLGCYPPPETIQSLKGKPETGINASDMVGMTGPVILGRAGRTPLPHAPQPIIRFPYAAPFEC